MQNANNSRRRKFYDQMSKSYNLGTFEEFDSKMNSAESREKLYKYIDGDGKYNIGTFDYFNEAMGPLDTPKTKPITPSSPAAETKPKEYPQPTDAAGNPLTNNGQPYSQEVLARYYSPDNKAGNYKDLATIAAEMDPQRPIHTTGGAGYIPENTSASEEQRVFDEEMRRLRAKSEWRNDVINTGDEHVRTTKGDAYDQLYKQFDEAFKNGQIGGNTAYSQASTLADQMGIGMEDKTQLLQTINRKYAKNRAKEVVSRILEQMPERSANLIQDLQGLYYNRDLQQQIMMTAAKMGNDYQDYVNIFIKPQLVEALKQKYGGEDTDWHGVRGLFSNWQHVGDRLENQDTLGMMSEHFAPAIDAAIDEAEERAVAKEQELMKDNPDYYVPGTTSGFGKLGASAYATRQGNKLRDPELIEKEFNDRFFGPSGEGAGGGTSKDKLMEIAVQEILKDENLKNNILERAKNKNMDPLDYTEKYVVPQFTQSIRDRFEQSFIQRAMPKSTFEHIMKGLTEDNIIAMIANRYMRTDAQQRYANMADAMTAQGLNPNVNPDVWAEGARLATGMAADFWLWGGWGKLGAKATGELLAKRVAERAAAEHITISAATRLIEEEGKQYLKKGIVEGMMRHMPSSMVTLGGAEGTTTFVKGIRDREDAATILGNTLGSAASGAITGAMFGFTGGATSRLTSKLSGAKRLAGKMASFGVEAATMYTAEELQKMANGEDAFQNPYEGLINSGIKLGFIKLSANPLATGVRLIEAIKNPVADIKGAMTPNKPLLTEDDVRIIRESADGAELIDALTRMRPARKTDKEDREGYISAEDAEIAANDYRNFMKNPEYSWVLKNKVAHLLGGAIEPPGYEVETEILNTDKGTFLRTRDIDGNLINETRYNTREEADKADKAIMNDLFNNKTQALQEKINNLDAYVRFKEYFENAYQQIATKHESGQELTKAEKQIVYLHQHIDELTDIYKNLQAGEELSEKNQNGENQDLVDLYVEHFNAFVKQGKAAEAYEKDYEAANGLPSDYIKSAVEGHTEAEAKKIAEQTGEGIYSFQVGNETRCRTHSEQKAINDYQQSMIRDIKELERQQKQQEQTSAQQFVSEDNLLPDLTDKEGIGEAAIRNEGRTVTPPTTTGNDSEGAPISRSERRNAAYQKGMGVSQDDTTLYSIGHDNRVAEARMMQYLPDGSNTEAVRKNIMQAVEAGDLDAAEQIFANAAPRLNATQIDAIENYLDAAQTQLGIDDAITEQAAAFEQRQRQKLQNIADHQGNITELQMKDGSIVYLLAGDLNNHYGSIMVTDGNGNNQQRLVRDVAQIGQPRSVDDVLADNVNDYAVGTQQLYNDYANGSIFRNGQQVDMMIAGQPVRAIKTGNDANGNLVFTMEDGSQIALSLQEAQESVMAADNAAIQQQLQQEAESARLVEQQQRFTSGIKGYGEGHPDLSAPETDSQAAAEYLLSETMGDDKLRKQRLTYIDNTRQQLQQRSDEAKRELSQLNQWLAGNEDIVSPEEVAEAKAKIEQLNTAIADVDNRMDKWGEIRRNLMTPEERTEMEQQRRREIFNARTGYEPQVPQTARRTNADGIVEEDGKANFGLTSVGNANNYLLRNFDDAYQAEQFINGERVKLRNVQRDEIQPAMNVRNDILNAYATGKVDMTSDELKQITHEVADLEAQQDLLSQQAIRLREIAEGIQNLYERNNRGEELSPAEQRAKELDKAGSKEDKLRIARTLYNNYPEALDRINDQEPRDLEEFIAANLGLGSMNWEGYDQGGRHLIGVQEAVFGKRGATRGIGKGYATNAFNHYLAPTGEGKDFNTIVHGLYESLPDVGDGKQWSTEDISNALINMLLTAQKPSDISHRIINNRIAEAEDIVQRQEEYDREMEEQAKMEEMQQWADAYHLTPEEREEFEEFMKMVPTEPEQEIINNIIADEQDSRSNGLDSQSANQPVGGENQGGEGEVRGQGSSEEVVGNQNQQSPERAEDGNGVEAVPDTDVSGGAQERVAQIEAGVKEFTSEYNSVPVVQVSLDMPDKEFIDTLGVPEFVLNDYESIEECAKELRQQIIDTKTFAFYNAETGKIVIFAAQTKPERLREALFHENIHAVLHSWYGDGVRVIAKNFWDAAPEDGKVKKSFIQKRYDESEWNEELLTTWLGKSLKDGDVNDLIQYLTDPGDIQRVDNILKTIGYDRAKETTRQASAEKVDEKSSERRSVAGQRPEERVEDNSFSARLAKAISETNTNPTEAQKEAGNYRKPEIRFGGYTFRIENPKGSIRSGVDANGNKWSQEMHDTYGYIMEKTGKDGDKMDFFINDDADLDNFNGRVYVIDQKNEDGTFDEHKVMYGYPTLRAAREAYKRNYEDGWYDKHVMAIMGVKKADFDKWLADSDHKIKPFSEYFRTKILKDAVRDDVDQLMADVEERKAKEPEVVSQYTNEQLSKMDITTLSQLIKKAQKDAATSRYLLGTTNIQPGSDKEHILKRNIAQAEKDVEALTSAQNELKAKIQKSIEDAEAGGAIVDHLQDIGIDVSTNLNENRKIHKKGENDNSKEGKLKHMRTPDGKVYGFTYRGKMYLDPRMMDAERPLHEYGHLWGEAFRRLNPEGWKNVVDTMKQDADTWNFVKHMNPDLTSDDDIAEEMIAKGTGEKGKQRVREEFDRMAQRDPSYKGKWNNIWKNISKAIQDFWKQVGDFLHIRYESTQQVYDQVLKDFANGVNPRKKVEEYLKQRDAEYAEAIKSGDTKKATQIFNDALKENVGNGMTPYIAVDKYRKMQSLAHKIKNGDAKGISQAAELMAPLIPENAVLIPAPSHSGKAITILQLANAIAERTGSEVADILESSPRASQYEIKKQGGKAITAKDMGIFVNSPIPEGKVPVVIDNVVDTGNTAEACIKALGTGIVASLADSTEIGRRVASLRSAAPIIANREGELVPLSQRFDLSRKETARPVDIDNLMDEVENRIDTAGRVEVEAAIESDKAEAGAKAVNTAVRDRATKAVVKVVSDTGVPIKQVSREEADQMMQLFTMMNRQAIADFARSQRPSEIKRYAVINVRDPFAVPKYFEKRQYAQEYKVWGNQGKGLYDLLDLGYDDTTEQNTELKEAAGIMPDIETWHGSGAVFTKFDHSHMGEGAGSQTFGWGTYLSGSKKIGSDYARMLNRGWTYQGKHLDDIEAIHDGKNHKSGAIRDILSAMNHGDRLKDAKERSIRFIKSAIRDYEEEMQHLSEEDKQDLNDMREILSYIESLKMDDFKKDPENLYKVEIPEDTGENYLDWTKELSEERLRDLQNHVFEEMSPGLNSQAKVKLKTEIENKVYGDGQTIYDELMLLSKQWLGYKGTMADAGRYVSDLLAKSGYTGIKYPAGTIFGGGEGATNYVIFDEDDAMITEIIQFMFDDSEAEQPMFQKGQGGRVYGWTDGTGIYLTPDGLNPNTPMHEYTHLWDKYIQREDHKLWKEMVAAFKKTTAWQELRQNPNYRSIWDDENKMASEVHSRLTGARTQEEFEKAAASADGKDTQSIINQVKDVLRKFWEKIAQLFGRGTDRLEEFILMPLRDALAGLNPIKGAEGYSAYPEAMIDQMAGEARVINMNRPNKYGLNESNPIGRKLTQMKQKQGANALMGYIDSDYDGYVFLGNDARTIASIRPKYKLYDDNGMAAVYVNAKDFSDLSPVLISKGYMMGLIDPKDVEIEPEPEPVAPTKPEVKSWSQGELFTDADFMEPEPKAEAEEPAEQPKQQGTDLTQIKLRHLDEGEVCHVERRYEETGSFSFTGSEKIESLDDVAYIFRELQNAAVENTFVVLEKNGVPTVIHLGMGDFNSSPAPVMNVFAAYKEINPDKVYFVHNHPSGNLICSKQDQDLFRSLDTLFGSKLQDGIIINTTSGKYGIFNQNINIGKEDIPQSARNEMPLKVYRFSKQVFDKDWNPETAFEAKSPFKVAQFISSHRLGKHKKMSLLVIDQSRHITGNIFLPWTKLKDAANGDNAKLIATYVTQMGGNGCMLYGNYGYDTKDDKAASKLKLLLKNHRVNLYDMIHMEGDNSYYYRSMMEQGVMEPGAMAEDVVSEPVTDENEIKRLEQEPKEIGYRNVVLNDNGEMGSPMADKLGGKGKQSKATTNFKQGSWERSDENPDLVDENGKIDLIKPDGLGKVGKVDYNPYIHIRPDKVNKQFKNAWERPNLVYVEVEYPASELTSGYKADKAKKSVGRHPWNGEELILSRWDKVTRVVPWEEVADDWVKRFKDRGVEFDIVPPGLLPILVERGVEILPPHKGMSKDCNDAYEVFKNRPVLSKDASKNEILAAISSNVTSQEVEQAMNSKLVKRWLSSGRGVSSKKLSIFNTFGFGVDYLRTMAKARLGITNKYHVSNALFYNAVENLQSLMEFAKEKGLDTSIADKYDWKDSDTIKKLLDSDKPIYTDKEVEAILKVVPGAKDDLKGMMQAFADENKILEEVDNLRNYDNGDAVTKAFAIYDIAIRRLREQYDKDERFYRPVTYTKRAGSDTFSTDTHYHPDYQPKEGEEVETRYQLRSDVSNEILSRIATAPVSSGNQKQLEGVKPQGDNGNMYRRTTPAIEKLNSAANTVKNFDNPSLSEENLRNIYAKEVDAAEQTAELLGGEKVIFESESPEPRVKAWFDPKDETIHVVLPEHANVDDIKRSVFHEKLGHEGLVALLGNQGEVNKFGHFVFKSASKELKQRIIEKADANDPDWNDPLRFSHAAQEVIADIAENGPRTADEFSLWQKIKHYIIRFCNRIGLKIRGLLNDHDLAYYILKTGEALKTWNGMSAEAKAEAATMGYDPMYSRRGKPRKRNNESMAQYLQRLREWEKWKRAEELARENNDPMPNQDEINSKWEEKFRNDLAAWRERTGIEYDQTAISPFPKRGNGETPQDYARRVADYETQVDLFKEAPSFLDYMQQANDEYKREYLAWRQRYDLAEEENVDLNLYDGTGGEGPQTDADLETEEVVMHELAQEMGIDLSADGAKRHAKLAVIERRKNIESANAEDAIWIYNLIKSINEEAKSQGIEPKELRKHLADIIEGTYFEDVIKDEHGNIISIENISDQLPIKMTPGLQAILDDIKVWFDEFYALLGDAGLVGNAGYIPEGYINHVWDKKRSNPDAYKKYVENYQRTKSRNMKERIFDTYRAGEDVGLVRKFDDITEILAYYSADNNHAIGNRKFLDDLTGLQVEELNTDGEVVSVLPLLSSSKPDAFTRDRYEAFYVPGVGDVYVLKDIEKFFSNVFGNIRTKHVPEVFHQVANVLDTAASTSKKIELALSGFHALALWEVAIAQQNPIQGLKALFKYVFYDSFKNGWTVPAYAHPDDFKFAASHLVQLGATEDYAASDVKNITGTFKRIVNDLMQSDNNFKKAAGVTGSLPAYIVDFVNRSFDTVLWNYMHDGLKIYAMKHFKAQIDKRAEKQGLSEEERNKLYDEAGQYVNDMFGGQYWEILGISPAAIKWARRALLSPDWFVSTQRHFFAMFGIGSLYSEGGFINWMKYNADNIKRTFGIDIPHDEYKRFRSKNAKICYLIGAVLFFGAFYNAINMLNRWIDEEDEKRKADEIRKTFPEYKSPYEIKYPDGMKWYDYTMYGNAPGQRTHLFTGRYHDGTETYVRWGKQFREFPELFIGKEGFDFPTPILERLMSKKNPLISGVVNFLGAAGISGFEEDYRMKEVVEKYGRKVAMLKAFGDMFVPFGVSTQPNKEYKPLDFFMPSSKGFSRYKAIHYYEDFIMKGDMDGIRDVYNACIMNGVDPDATLKAAMGTIRATQRKELSDGITDLTTAVERFNNAKDLKEKKIARNKMIKYLNEQSYKSFTREEAVEAVENFLNGEQVSNTENNRYVELESAEDIRNDWHLSVTLKQAKKYVDEIKTAEGDRQKKLAYNYQPWIQIHAIIKQSDSAINKLKKQLGKGNDDAELMKQIRDIRTQTQKKVDEVEAPK